MTLPTTFNVLRPQSAGFDGRLDELLFRLAVGADRRQIIQTAPLQAQRFDTDSAGFAEDIGGTFDRVDFSGGEGLDRAYRIDDPGDDYRRFYDSRRVEFIDGEAGQSGQVRLLHQMESSEAATGDVFIASADGRVYFSDGTTTRYATDVTGVSVTWTADDPHLAEGATTVTGLAALGDDLYAGLGANGIHVRVAGGAWAHYSDVLATRIWSAKGRIIASDGPNLYEVIASGVAPTALLTLSAGRIWTDVVDAGSHVLASSDDGTVYSFAFDGAALTLATQSPFTTEVPTALGSAYQQVFIATAENSQAGGVVGRLYSAALDNDGILSDRTLIRQWGNTETTTLNRAPRRVVTTRDSVWTALPDPKGGTHTWRYSLSKRGLFRQFEMADTGAVYGLGFVEGRLLAGVSASGLWRELDAYEESGYLISPMADFLQPRDKSWSLANLDAKMTDDSQSATLSYATVTDALLDSDSVSWVPSITVASNSDESETALTNVTSRQLAVKINLTTSDTTASPLLSAFYVRAYPAGGDVIATLPISMSDRIERPGRKPIRVPGLADDLHAALKEREGKSVVLRLFNPSEVIRGLVFEVGTPITTRTRRGGQTVYAQVIVRGRRADVLETDTAQAGMGQGVMGLTLLGAGEA